MNYFSVSFAYKAAVRGFGGGGFHVSLSVDELAESHKLTEAMRVAQSAMELLKIEHRHEYCWPDGSLYYYARTEYSYADLFYLLSLASVIPVKLIPCEEDEPSGKYGSNGEKTTLVEYFKSSPSPKGSNKRYFMQVVAQRVMLGY